MRSRSQLSWNLFVWNVLLPNTHIPGHFLQTLGFVDPWYSEAFVFAQQFLGLHHYSCNMGRRKNRLQRLLIATSVGVQTPLLSRHSVLWSRWFIALFSGSYTVEFRFSNPGFFKPPHYSKHFLLPWQKVRKHLNLIFQISRFYKPTSCS